MLTPVTSSILRSCVQKNSISTWVPPFIGGLAAKSGLVPAQWASYAGMSYTVGSILGYISLGFLADAYGRKPVTLAYMVLNGQYTWMPVWLPELYPTRMRATALAFAFNAPRFIAFLGPLLAGTMIVKFGGIGPAAMVLASIYVVGIVAVFFLPETRGKPLPA